MVEKKDLKELNARHAKTHISKKNLKIKCFFPMPLKTIKAPISFSKPSLVSSHMLNHKRRYVFYAHVKPHHHSYYLQEETLL